MACSNGECINKTKNNKEKCGLPGAAGRDASRTERQIYATFRRLTRDERSSRIKNRRQVWRSVRSLLPAVRAVAGFFRVFQSGVKIERVISLLRSLSLKAYCNKKKVGVMPRKRCYREQKGQLSLCRMPEQKLSYLADEHAQKLRRKTKNKPRRSSVQFKPQLITI